MRKFDVEATNRSLSHGKYGAGNPVRKYSVHELGEYGNNSQDLPKFDVHETNSDLALCCRTTKRKLREEKFIYTTVQ